MLIEVSEWKSNPEVSSLKLQYYIESDFERTTVQITGKYRRKIPTLQPNLAKKNTKKKQERKLMIKELTMRICSSCELTGHYLNCIM